MQYLNEDQELMLDAVRDFNENELAPRVLTDLENDVFPGDLYERMNELGLTAVTIPQEYGGLGETMVLQAAIEKELAKQSMTMAMASSATSLTAGAVLRFGTQEQIDLFMPQMIGGKPVGFAITEPCAGSDVSAIQSEAKRDGDGWTINGQKTFISFAAQSDVFIVGARTMETDKGGLSTFIVPKDAAGFSTGEPFHKMGFRGSGTAELFLDGVHVPAINLIGRENKGMHVALSLLDEARVGVAACAVGLCEAAIEKATSYIKERVAFGRPLSAQQGLQWYAAEMDAKTAAANALLFQAAASFDAQSPTKTLDAARAKLIATRTALEVTDLAIQMCGGLGLMNEFGVERLHRDAKVLTIIEGTDEILKMVISRAVLA